MNFFIYIKNKRLVLFLDVNIFVIFVSNLKTIIMIICIDLTEMRDKEYRILQDKYPALSPDGIKNAQKAGFSKVWITTKDEEYRIVAFTHPKSSKEVSVIDIEMFLETIQPENFQDIEEGIIDSLDTDEILDKISRLGIDKISLIEKEFLDKSL